MKKTAVFAVLLLCIAAVLTAGCINDEPAEPIDYPTALVGDWKSEKPQSVSETVEFYTIYKFNNDNTGKVVADVNGEVLSSIDVFWGYVEYNHYVVGYPKSQQVISYYILKDGLTIVDDYGNKFIKL